MMNALYAAKQALDIAKQQADYEAPAPQIRGSLSFAEAAALVSIAESLENIRLNLENGLDVRQ